MDRSTIGAITGAAGVVGGVALAPFTALGSFVRHSRIFHPEGTVLMGRSVPIDAVGPAAEAARRLAGPVVARFSGAWWKRRQLPDVLGCALRFTSASPPHVSAAFGDQDLLLATIRNPVTTLLAPLTTNVRDYLKNDYFGVSPFMIPDVGRVKLRLHPVAVPNILTGSRAERLVRAIHAGPLRFDLELRANALGSGYRPFVRIEFTDYATVDQAALAFDPFNAGRGVEPVGFIHHLRMAAYAASRTQRPRHA